MFMGARMVLVVILSLFLLPVSRSEAIASTSSPPSSVEDVPKQLGVDECSVPLGMEHGHIKDADIRASSAFDHNSVGPQNARINKDQYGGAWCPKEAVEKGVREWIEIDLHKDYRITRTGTQGRYGGGRGREYTEEFIFEYWRAGMKKWRVYRNHSGHDILPGNKNTYVVNVNELNPPIVASKVRFVPHSTHPRTVCMRVEVYGCVYETGLLSYSAPPGDEFSPHVYLSDIYDGEESQSGRLEGGLGVLTDGQPGGNISYSPHGIESAPGWVGWKKLKHDVELVFEFNSVRKFESITFVTHANRDMGIQPFSHMVASFGVSASRYDSYRLTKPNKRAALELSDVDSVTLPLDGRSGKFLKVQLFFTDKWILLSEISFESKSIPPGRNSSSVRGSLHYPLLEEEDVPPASKDMMDANDVRSGIFDKTEEKKKAVSSVNSIALSDTPREEESPYRGEETPASEGPESNSPTQVYIGLIIGVLGVTVLLLLVTIAVMMRRNKQKIFNKHSLFKSPNLTPNGRLHHPSYASAPTSGGIITLRDLKQQQASSVSAQMYGSPPHLGSGVGEDSDEGSSYYHEPYRLILKPSNNSGKPPLNSNSCGRLCEYEEFGLLEEQKAVSSAQTSVKQAPLLLSSLEKSKFGSTPMFPPPPPSGGHIHHKLYTPVNNNNNSSGGPGPSSSYKSSANGYATTDFVKKKWHPHHHPLLSSANESFYAATDILSGDRTKDEEEEKAGALGHYLRGSAFSPMMYRSLTEEPEAPIPEYSRRNLRMIEKLGQGNFGMAHLCETSSLRILPPRLSRSFSSCSSSKKSQHRLTDSSLLEEETEEEEELSGEYSDTELYENGRRRVILVRSLWKPTSEFRRKSFLESVRRQSVLKGCPNFAHILAICTEDEPICVLTEYPDLGDLRQFLKTRRYSISSSLDPGTLLSISVQISNGMKYLEKLGYVHRDLATRNCLIDSKHNIKITDFAMFRPAYAKDYFQMKDDSKEIIPLRWIPWEVYIMGAWSIKSDVWSFGVTLWEIFNDSHDTVFGDLNDEQVIENLNHWYHSDGFHLLPSTRSLSCSKELLDLMNECWSRDPDSRPKFSEIHNFLNNKVMGLIPPWAIREASE